MPIFDQGYQHWHGRLSGHAWRWLSIMRQGVRQQQRWWVTRGLVFVAFAPALILAAFLVLWGLLEQQSSLLQPLMFLLQGLPAEVREGPKAFRGAVWTMAFDWFFSIETFFAMLLVLTVGPDLVSKDLRFNAMPLYFSRPLRRLDYFLGKLGVIAVFLAAVAIGPALAAYLLGVGFSLDLTVFRDTWRVLLGSMAYGALVVVSAGTLMLAVSSLSRNSRLVGAMFVGLWVVSNVTSAVLTETVARKWCPLVSYTTNLERLREELLDTPSARRKFLTVWEAGRQAREEAARPFFLFGRRRNRRPPPPEVPPPALLDPEYLKYPWAWSGYVVLGLLGLSVVTLSTRVRSLDRLR